MRFLGILFLLSLSLGGQSWGFFAHRQINRLAVFTLPPEMSAFYKKHIDFITEHAVNPDRRRYVIQEEGPRHYIDLDALPDSVRWEMPKYWKEAVEIFGEDSLQSIGIVPWHIHRVKGWLVSAFLEKDVERILSLSTDLGHYLGDAHVPLHTTENYNGQLTGQDGIHAFWESRIPELFFSEFDLWTGQAEYLYDTQQAAWAIVYDSHRAMDSVLVIERQLTSEFTEAEKFTITPRGKVYVKTYSEAFAASYRKKLNGMVERRMRASIKSIGDFWYTAWVDAGQPDLTELLNQKPKKSRWPKRKINTSRPHEH